MPNQRNNQPDQELLGLYGLGDYNTQQIKVFARESETEDLSPKNFYDRRPDAAPDSDQYIKNMSPETAAFIVPDAFAGQKGIELLENMTIEQLEKIGAGNDPVLKLAIKNAFNRADKKSSQIKEISQYFNYSPAWQF